MARIKAMASVKAMARIKVMASVRLEVKLNQIHTAELTPDYLVQMEIASSPGDKHKLYEVQSCMR